MEINPYTGSLMILRFAFKWNKEYYELSKIFIHSYCYSLYYFSIQLIVALSTYLVTNKTLVNVK